MCDALDEHYENGRLSRGAYRSPYDLEEFVFDWWRGETALRTTMDFVRASWHSMRAHEFDNPERED